MKQLFTTFGRDYRFDRLEHNKSDIFYGMPPALITQQDSYFIPDYSAFLLSDEVVMDGVFFERLIHNPHPLYKKVSSFFKLAYDEGIVTLSDYDNIYSNDSILLNEMLKKDLENIELWKDVLKNSQNIWNEILKNTNSEIIHEISREEQRLENIRPQMRYEVLDEKQRELELSHTNFLKHLGIDTLAKSNNFYTEKTLRSYFSYINSNILLSYFHGAAIFDWPDLFPFYQEKFLGVGLNSPTINNDKAQLEKLFSLIFPDIKYHNPSKFIKLIQHKGVEELRTLCNKATNGVVVFNHDYGINILQQALEAEQIISKKQKQLSWYSTPLGLIPGIGAFIQKPIEELAGKYIDAKYKKPMQWYFIVSKYLSNN